MTSLDTEDGFTEWDETQPPDRRKKRWNRPLRKNVVQSWKSELEQDEHPVDYDAELETEEEEAAPVSEKRLKREIRAEAMSAGGSGALKAISG